VGHTILEGPYKIKGWFVNKPFLVFFSMFDFLAPKKFSDYNFFLQFSDDGCKKSVFSC